MSESGLCTLSWLRSSISCLWQLQCTAGCEEGSPGRLLQLFLPIFFLVVDDFHRASSIRFFPAQVRHDVVSGTLVGLPEEWRKVKLRAPVAFT
jgi:hypothetical protein